jgi:hypothetical protein
MVPGERIELPTNGLQNHFSKAEVSPNVLEAVVDAFYPFSDSYFPGARPERMGRFYHWWDEQ